MAEEPQQIPEKTGLVARIHNSSNRTILLIPIRYVYYDYHGPIGIVVKNLARKIPGGGSIELDRSNYDFNSEIFILFRPGDIDDVEEFLDCFGYWGTILKPGEMLFLIGHLDNLSLECNDGKVIGSSGAGLLPPTTIAKAPITKFREAPITESTPSQARRKVIVPRQIPEWVSSGLKAPPTKIHNNSDVPIFLIPISWGVVRKDLVDLVKEIPAGGFKAMDSREYDPVGNTYYYGSPMRILFRAGHTNNDEKFPGDVKVEPGEELYSPHYLSEKGDLFLSFNEAAQVIEVDQNSVQISGMEFFRNAQAVRLRNCHGQFLVADDDEETVALRNRDEEEREEWDRSFGAYLDYVHSQGEDRAMAEEKMRLVRQQIEDSRRQRDNSRRWYVEFVGKSDSVLHLKSCHGKYLTASGLSSPPGMTGSLVLQSPNSSPDFSLDLEPVKVGSQVKLRTRYDTFLCANSRHPYRSDPVTHDLCPGTAIILWDVEVGERVEGTATNIDGKASEEGSTSDIDDKASFPTKRRYETGEGSSVTKTPSGDSGLIREGDWVRYRRHFWELKRRLLDKSGRKDVLVKGGSGTTALVREVCADVREHFGTIAWISIPRENDSAFIREEILVQLIYERVAASNELDVTWMLKDRRFSLNLGKNSARCLIVVDNLDDPKTWKKFEEILLIVGTCRGTCRVIFIAGHNKDSSYSQIEEHGRDFEIYEGKGLSDLPPKHYLNNFLEKVSTSLWKRVYQLIVKKCQRLRTAIVFILRNEKEKTRSRSSYITKDEWEARIPSDKL